MPTLEAVLAEKGRRRLADFVRAAWPVVEPGRPLRWGWHLDAMCDHLEAVTRGDLTNLLITIPPGCTKSRLVGVFWPAWTWLPGRWPECRWLFFSNADDLATRESMACRRLIESEWYRTHYPDAVQITTDQNTKTWYENDRAGHRQSMSVLASVTGKKGDVIAVDDANDAEKVQSAAVRDQINGRWDNAIYDRVIDFKIGRRVVIGQRTHTSDLIGHIKATGPEFVELCIPEEFDRARRFSTPIGWSDPRQKDGEFLRPDQFEGPQKAAAIRRLGSIGYATKHNQNPTDPGGNRFKKDWFKHRYQARGDYLVLRRDGEAAARELYLWGLPQFITVDPAASAKTSADFTVALLWAQTPNAEALLLDGVRFQAEIPDVVPRVVALWEKWRKRAGAVLIEGLMANVGVYQIAARVAGFPAKKVSPLGQDKLVRATPAMILAEAGRIWLPAPGLRPDLPLADIEGEWYRFTGDDNQDGNDDAVDCLSYCVWWLQHGNAGAGSMAPHIIGGQTR